MKPKKKAVKAHPFKFSLKHGLWTATCPLHLWSVAGQDMNFVINEGYHYYAQYYSGGEYASRSLLPTEPRKLPTP